MSKTCFIVGPIGQSGSDVRKLADWLLHGVFKPVLESEELGYKVKRADDDANPGSITNAVVTDVIDADLVIADLTGFNPNAFYELGVRHMTGKPTIHVIAEVVTLPFDNKDQRTIFIDITDYRSVEAGRETLRKAALATSQEGYRVSNPVTQAQGFAELRDSADPKDQVIADLEERVARLERRPAKSGDIVFNSKGDLQFERSRSLGEVERMATGTSLSAAQAAALNGLPTVVSEAIKAREALGVLGNIPVDVRPRNE